MNANKALYLSIKKAVEARGLTYEALADQIGYSLYSIKKFMYFLRLGKNGSRFVKMAIFAHFGGKILEEVQANEAD